MKDKEIDTKLLTEEELEELEELYPALEEIKELDNSLNYFDIETKTRNGFVIAL